MPSKPLKPTPAELLRAITAAGGTLTIPDPPRQARAGYRRSIHYLINSGDLLGADRRLRYTGRDQGDLVLSVVSVGDRPRPREWCMTTTTSTVD